MRSERQPQPMHVVSLPRIASSVAMRSSSSRFQLRESRSQSRFVGFLLGGQLVERGPDPLERDARGLARLHERDAPQGDGRIAPLVAVRAPCRDQPFALVEAEGGLGDAAPCGELADGQFPGHLT